MLNPFTISLEYTEVNKTLGKSFQELAQTNFKIKQEV